MVSYINETDFVVENKKLVYPEIVTDGLQLYYDAKGKRDTDYHRDTMLDMSGNKNHGKLHNFAYEKHSGYKDGLVFDYIDDKLVRPTLNLKPDDFTFMLNGNIISFSPDGTVKRVQDGEVIESKGFNLIRNGDFADGLTGWSRSVGNEAVVNGNEVTITTTQSGRFGLYQDYNQEGLKYISAEYYSEDETKTFTLGSSLVSVTIPNGVWTRVSTVNSDKELIRFYADSGADKHYKMRKPLVIDLTETFGAGNEPTKEQMDEIIQRFGFVPNAQDLIDRIEYKGNVLGDMENIIEGLYKTEILSGEEIYTDKADDSVVHVDVDGKSYQPSYITNLFTKKTVYGDIYSINTGVWLKIIQGHKYYTRRTFTSDSTAGSFGSIRMLGTAPHIFVGNSQMGDYGQITEYTGETRTGEVMFYGSNGAPSGGKIENTFIIDLTSHFGAGNEPSRNEMNKITDALGWFSGNKVYSEWISELRTIPTPDYPIEIYSLNDFDVVSSVGKRNLLTGKQNGNYRLYSNNGKTTPITYKSYEDYDSVVLTYGNQLSTYSEERITLEKGKEYLFSMYVYSLVKLDLSIINYYGDVWTTVPANTWTRLDKIIIGTGENQRLPSMYSRNAEALNHEIFYNRIKLEEGKVSSYSLAPEDITESDNHPLIDKINILLDEPLRSVGDVKDKLFRDSDGLWKVERNVGVLELANYVWSMGAESSGWFQSGETVSAYGYHIRYEHDPDVAPLVTNMKGYANSPLVSGDLEGFSVGGNNNYSTIRINKSRLSEVSSIGITNWIKENSPIVYYALKTEYSSTEILDQELQDKLNNIRSFEDSNYVYTVDGSTNLLDTVPLLNNHWYPSSGTLQNPVTQNGHTSTQEPLPVYPGVKIHLTKETTVDNYWRIVWVDKDNNVVIREVSTVNDLILTAPKGAYGMRVSYPNNSNAVIKFDKSGITQTISENLKPTLHAKFLYNNWYKEDRVINNLMIYNRTLTNEEMLQNYKTIKRRWGM